MEGILSLRRRPDREAACHPDFQAEFDHWIPAFAGMTIEKRQSRTDTI
jgi:hypothetical protein